MNLFSKIACHGLGAAMFGLHLSLLGLLGSFDPIGADRWDTDAGFNLTLLTFAVSSIAPVLLIKYRKAKYVKGYLVLAALVCWAVLLVSWRLEASALIRWDRMDGSDALLTMFVLTFFVGGSLCWFRLPFQRRARRTTAAVPMEHELSSAEYRRRRRG